jgi:hypothetical protein
MEACDQFHALVALTEEKEQRCTLDESRWTPDPVRTLWGR